MTTASTTPGPSAIGADDKELAAGIDIGEYRIESVLGRGGFGTVYGAVQPVIGKRVAIKVLARKFAADPDVVSRFVAEARAVNQIRHRNIIDIFSFGQLTDGRHYYVMEHLDGQPLDGYLRDHGRMPLADALPILRSIARALDAAHAKGIAHRDLKPENIFLAHDTDGTSFPKLLDFGIAKLLAPDDEADIQHRTATGVPIGTPYYMSPEQCRGRDVDHRTDMYSFGVVAYRLLTGVSPFEGSDYMELLFKHTNDEPALPSSVQPDLPPSVDIAIAWMMRKERDARPKTVLDGVNALDPSAQVTPAPPSRTSRKGALAFAQTGISSPNAFAETRPSGALPPAPRRRWIVPLLGVLLLGAGAVAFVLMQQGDKPAPTAAPVSDKPAPPAKPAAVAIAVDAAATPDHVIITLVGVPDGAEVLSAGKTVGVGSKVQLPYSDNDVFLVVQADGFISAQIQIKPDQDREVSIKMKKKPARPAASQEPDRDSLPAFPDRGKTRN